MTESVIRQLQDLKGWEDRWQVVFTATKTQAMGMSRSRENMRQLQTKLRFGNYVIPLRDSVYILGVEWFVYISTFTFKMWHAKPLRRGIVSLLSVGCHLYFLDKLQRQTERVLGSTASQPSYQGPRQHRNQHKDDERTEQKSSLDSLEHCRRVASLTMLHKVQVVQVSQLTDPRKTWRKPIC